MLWPFFRDRSLTPEQGETCFYPYRGKGGKRGRRELPHPAYEAICASLVDAGKDLAAMAPDESLWQAAARPTGVTSGTFYARFRRYLKLAGMAPTGIHVLRHTAAKLRRRPPCPSGPGVSLAIEYLTRTTPSLAAV